jgi:hypothetical protein
VSRHAVIWYGRQGIVDKEMFDAEKTARDHAISMFQTRKGDDGIVSAEVRKENGTVVLATRRIREIAAIGAMWAGATKRPTFERK